MAVARAARRSLEVRDGIPPGVEVKVMGTRKRLWSLPRIAIGAALAVAAGASIATASTSEDQNPLDAVVARLDCGTDLIAVSSSVYAPTGGRMSDPADSARSYLQRRAPHLLPGLTRIERQDGENAIAWITRADRTVARLDLDRDRGGWKIRGVVGCRVDLAA